MYPVVLILITLFFGKHLAKTISLKKTFFPYTVDQKIQKSSDKKHYKMIENQFYGILLVIFHKKHLNFHGKWQKKSWNCFLAHFAIQYYLVPIYNSQNFIIIASREIYVADRNGKTTFPPKSFLASSHKTQWGEKLKQSAIRLYVLQVWSWHSFILGMRKFNNIKKTYLISNFSTLGFPYSKDERAGFQKTVRLSKLHSLGF